MTTNKNHRFNRWNIWREKLRTTLIPPLLRLAAPLVYVRRRLKPHKVELCKISGTVAIAEDSLPFTFLCGATMENKNFLRRLAFDGLTNESELGSVPARNIFRQPAWKKDCSLIVVETNQAHFEWLKQGNCFFVPCWVAGDIALPIAEKFMRSNSIKNDLRTLRRLGLEYEIVPGEAAFKDFYHNMHVPYVTEIYGEEAFFDGHADQRNQSEQYDLLLVKQKIQPNRHIAGVLIVYEPAGPRLWSFGVRPGHSPHGITPALYHFAFDYLTTKGFTHVSTGSSRAFLRDGVLKFKRKMSQTIVNASWKGFALKIIAYTPATKTFLQQNPFIFQADGKLCGAVFTEEILTSEMIRKIVHNDFHTGLNKLVFYSFREDALADTGLIPPELASHVEIRSASELLD